MVSYPQYGVRLSGMRYIWFRDCLGKKRRLSPALMRSPQDSQRQRHIKNRVAENWSIWSGYAIVRNS